MFYKDCFIMIKENHGVCKSYYVVNSIIVQDT